MSTKLYQAPLSQAIHKELQKLIDTIQSVPTTLHSIKNMNGTGGLVSINDLLAYQIGWGNLLLEWYFNGLKRRIQQMPGEGFSNWDYKGLALHFYKKYAFHSTHKQIQELKNIVCSISEIVEKEYELGNLDKIGVWNWCQLNSGKEWPLSKWIQVNTVAPYKRASALIRKLI